MMTAEEERYDTEEAFLSSRRHVKRRWWPYLILADLPVIFYLAAAAITFALPGDTTHLLPNYELLGSWVSEGVLLAVYGGLALALIVTTGIGSKTGSLVAFGAATLWLLFVGFLQMWSTPQGPGGVANLALAMVSLVAFYRRMAASWVRRDIRRLQ